jgi:hypothetical protein
MIVHIYYTRKCAFWQVFHDKYLKNDIKKFKNGTDSYLFNKESIKNSFIIKNEGSVALHCLKKYL